MPHRATEKKDEQLPAEVKNYIMVELHCDMTQCKPCTYPTCPLLKKEDKKGVSSKSTELSKGEAQEIIDGKVAMKDDVKRYVMVEISCDRTKCAPCTYPNCQRFVRDTSIMGTNKKSKPKVRRVLLIDRNGKALEPQA
jgi:hypothetical protein